MSGTLLHTIEEMQLFFSRASRSTLSESGPGAHRSKLLLIANTLLLISLLLAFIFLFAQFRTNARLREETFKLKSTVSTMSGTIAGPPTIETGDLVPSFDALTLEGKPASILYDGSSRHLLFIFSARCGACMDQFPTWNQLASVGKQESLKIVGLSLDSKDTEAHLGNIERNFDVYVMSSKPVQRAYRVVSIPLVMLISPDGKVEWVHYGKLSEAQIKEISSMIGSK